MNRRAEPTEAPVACNCEVAPEQMFVGVAVADELIGRPTVTVDVAEAVVAPSQRPHVVAGLGHVVGRDDPAEEAGVGRELVGVLVAQGEGHRPRGGAGC